MGSTLTNGIYLPAEGERNCYEGLAANWTALDRLIGGYNAHVGNATIHVTAAEKETWNGKADASALTAHTGDTTIHVTAEDKATWNGKADASALTAHTGDTTIHVTAEDKAKWDAVTSKADDSDVVHKSGNETIAGVKIFSDSPLIYNSDSSASIPQISLKNQKVVKSSITETGAQLIYFVDKNNNALGQIEVRVVSNGTTGLNITSFGFDSNNQNISTGVQILRSPTTANFAPNANNAVTCGSPLAKWSDVQTYKINNLEPSSLSLPSGTLSNQIDISSYFTNTGTGEINTYTAPSNGWIYLRLGNISGCQATILDTNNNRMWGQSTLGSVEQITIPILKGQTLSTQWNTGSTVNVAIARFIPCQGNV